MPSMQPLFGTMRAIAGQAARMAFYAGHGALTRRTAARLARKGGAGAAGRARPLPGRAALRWAMLALMRDDLRHIRAGVYPAPALRPSAPLDLISTSLAYYRDLPAVLARRRRRGVSEMANGADAGYPGYYLQNFHYQSDGWLSDDSARIYDHQVEILFTGTADMMRRQGLPGLVARFRGQRLPRPRLLDIGAGTGRFLALVRRALPQARLEALEPSPHYRAAAAKAVPSARLSPGFIEAMPYADARFDAASAVFLFHELPPEIRRRAAHEIARVVKPDGLFLLLDSLQTGDRPEFDGLLDLFPERFHEPYFRSWLKEDILGLFDGAGFELLSVTPAFLSKAVLFRKRA